MCPSLDRRPAAPRRRNGKALDGLLRLPGLSGVGYGVTPSASTTIGGGCFQRQMPAGKRKCLLIQGKNRMAHVASFGRDNLAIQPAADPGPATARVRWPSS